jgi:hypothetical protein
MGSIRFCDELSRGVQPPDAENRMSGGVGGITGAIPLSPPDFIQTAADEKDTAIG